MMSIDEMIAVLQAAKAGKVIQTRHVNNDGSWVDLIGTSPSWNFMRNDYRVKPKPRTIWVAEYENGNLAFPNASKDVVMRSGTNAIRFLKFVEVIE